MLNKLIKTSILSSVVLTVLTGCGAENKENQTIKMWIAPNETQEAFWGKVVEEWNSHEGNMKVEFTTIPAAGSSEEAIMNAMASGTQPDMTTNIFSGFGAQLDELDQLVDFSKLDGYQTMIDSRDMTDIMNNWDYDGTNPVLPVYVSPVLNWWRTDLLEKNGFNTIPTSYEDAYKLSESFAVKNKQYAVQVAAGKNWWDRWFDFISLYYAQSGGAKYIEGNQAKFDNQAGMEVLTYIKKMFDNGWASYDFGANDPLTTGEVIGAVRGPWDISRYEKQYPEVFKTIKVGPVLTKDGVKADEKVSTLADSKGLVLFKNSEVKEEAWKFIQWVYTNPKNDLEWLKLTGMPPARGDLVTNPLFKEYYDSNPLSKEIASYVSVAIPPARITQTVDVQRSMTQMLERIIFANESAESSVKKSIENINNKLK